MTRQSELRALVRLTDTVFAARQATMARVRQQERLVRDRLAALDQARTHRADALAEAGDRAADPALAAGADLLWQAWIERRRAALNMELSRIIVAREAARTAVALSFGRHQATGALLARQILTDVKTRTRRDDAAS